MIQKIKPYKIETCAACGATNAEGLVVCSGFGPFSFPLCLKCISEGREAYRQVVDYIANAGRWPDDINEVYQEEVRRQLILHNKTEAEFAADIENALAFERAMLGGDF